MTRLVCTDPADILSGRAPVAFAPCIRTSTDRHVYSLVTTRAAKGTAKGKANNTTNTAVDAVDAERPLICQTPWMWVPHKPRYIVRNGKRTHFFDLALHRDSSDQHEWLRFLRALETTFRGWVQRRHGAVQWVSCVETPMNSYAFHDAQTSQKITPAPAMSVPSSVHWKFHTRLMPTVRCFDAARAETDVRDFLDRGQHSFVRLVVQLANVWVNEDTGVAGIGFQVLQFQCNGVAPPTTCVFRPEVAVTQCTVGTQTTSSGEVTVPEPDTAPPRRPTDAAERTSHPVYGTYFRMRAKGVPAPAVQHKMRMNGLDPTVLELPPDAPLPGGDDVEGGASGTNQGDALQRSLLDDRQLRKTEINATQPKPSNSAGHGFSLSEIVSGLQSLRRTFGLGGAPSRPRTSDDEGTETGGDDDASGTAVVPRRELGTGAEATSFLRLLAGATGKKIAT